MSIWFIYIYIYQYTTPTSLYAIPHVLVQIKEKNRWIDIYLDAMLLLVLMKDRRTKEDASIRWFVILSTSASGLHLSSSLGPVSPCLRVGRPRATAPPRQRGPVPVVGVLSLPPGDCPPCVYREYLLSTDVQDMNLHLFILLCTIDSCMHLLSPPLFTLASLNLPCYITR